LTWNGFFASPESVTGVAETPPSAPVKVWRLFPEACREVSEVRGRKVGALRARGVRERRMKMGCIVGALVVGYEG
jgi:hypothetical protein